MDLGIASTRGSLTRAKIIEVNNQRRQVSGGIEVACMFNPYEYTISKINTFSEPDSANTKSSPRGDFSKAGAQNLEVNLLFDTYADGKDVRDHTNKLWKLMSVPKRSDGKKSSPPLVAFVWGTFYFVAYIVNMRQTFTLFTHTGIPVRAKVTVSFTQYVDEEDKPPSDPLAQLNEGIQQAWRVIGGDRLDTIAQEVYGDATKWPLIAAANQLPDPLKLAPGQQLRIPIR